ncbi:unnamed protein product [Cyprideis torosa]|uniref:Uncharacterized protein n=1 Tax=Cyprideis torosa TaxID=163714 RepID=A0A7R8W2V9_9CRUS|nr:unnamed protein product [Cyprideis torosa]CAG0882378.1 unnamed protein product [Cyprideis torosa]
MSNYHQRDRKFRDPRRSPSEDSKDRGPSERELSEYYTSEIDERNHSLWLPDSSSDCSEITSRSGRYPNEHRYATHHPPISPLPIYGSASSYGHAAPPPSASYVSHHDNSRKRAEVETMITPNPYCPSTWNTCCLMILLNLALLLIVIGFILTLQTITFTLEWYTGISMLVVGFLTLLGTILFCVHVCRDRRDPDDLTSPHWAHHWKRSWDFGGRGQDKAHTHVLHT